MLFVEFRRFMNKMNAKNTLLHNRYILYAIFLVSVLNLFYMVIQRDYYASLVFIFTGILTSFFSKNMIVILSISLVVSYLLKNNANLEGFEEGIVDTAESSNASEINEAYLEEDTNNAENEHAENEHTENEDAQKPPDAPHSLPEEQSVIVREVNGKKAKKNQDGEELSSAEIKNMIDEQTELLEKLDKYEPFINTIQNIAKKFGFSDEEDTE